MIKKFLAYTLSEVLLVAATIGIISALTIPNIKKNQDEKSGYSKVRASISKIDAALQQVDFNESFSGKSTPKDLSVALLNNMDVYLKLHEKCGTQTNSNYCFTKKTITDIGTNNPVSDGNKCATAILNDGTEFAVCVKHNYPQTSNPFNTKDYYGYLAIDIDGAKKGDNKRGKDIFVFGITTNGLVVESTSPEANVLLDKRV